VRTLELSRQEEKEIIDALCAAAFAIYSSSSRLTLHFFLIGSTSVLLLIGAGLFSSACNHYQTYVFDRRVGADVEELGNGPGSYNVIGNVWHLVSCFLPVMRRKDRY
jgi:high-affinity Fe2+/Pb2+ permease